MAPRQPRETPQSLAQHRHAESQNNVVQREAEERLRMGEINAEEVSAKHIASPIRKGNHVLLPAGMGKGSWAVHGAR